jgi:mannose-6-phosphate isomerase-like protein (cupin superfamily)
VIDIPAEVAAHEPWFNQTLTSVNDPVVRLGIFRGEFHWHKHDGEDEFFLVLDGRLEIRHRGRRPPSRSTATRAYTVPRGVSSTAPARATRPLVVMVREGRRGPDRRLTPPGGLRDGGPVVLLVESLTYAAQELLLL